MTRLLSSAIGFTTGLVTGNGITITFAVICDISSLFVRVIATVVLPLNPGRAATDTRASLTVTALTPIPLNVISVLPTLVSAVVCDNFVLATEIGV